MIGWCWICRDRFKSEPLAFVKMGSGGSRCGSVNYGRSIIVEVCNLRARKTDTGTRPPDRGKGLVEKYVELVRGQSDD